MRTEHIEFSGRFYFFPSEKVSLPLALIFFSILILVPVCVGAHAVAAGFAGVCLYTVLKHFLVPAHRRAKALSTHTVYRISGGQIEFDKGARLQRVTYIGKSARVIRRKNDCVDIVIGGGISDYAKYVGSREKEAIALCGVTNGDEVIGFLERTGAAGSAAAERTGVLIMFELLSYGFLIVFAALVLLVVLAKGA